MARALCRDGVCDGHVANPATAGRTCVRSPEWRTLLATIILGTRMSKKLRLDQLLVEKGLFASREGAQRAVMAGEVKIGTRTAAKSAQLLEPDAEIAVKPTRKYVGRGGLKLESALDYFEIDVNGKIATANSIGNFGTIRV